MNGLLQELTESLSGQEREAKRGEEGNAHYGNVTPETVRSSEKASSSAGDETGASQRNPSLLS